MTTFLVGDADLICSESSWEIVLPPFSKKKEEENESGDVTSLRRGWIRWRDDDNDVAMT